MALELETLRTLTVSNAVPGRPPHLSAGSGLVRRGDFVYVVGDDELDLACFKMGDSSPGELTRLFEGALPLDIPERHHQKPDLEALCVLPPFKRNPYGALLALGSGSGESRARGFVWSLDDDGALRGFPRVVDTQGLFDFLKQHVTGKLNIEGVTVAGEHVVLFQRGNSKDGRNMVFRLSTEEVVRELLDDFTLTAQQLLDAREYDLGEVNGGKLDFSDGDALPDGRLVFSAAAEVGMEGPDSTIAGSVIGIIGVDGEIEHTEPLADASQKVEGVDAVLADGMVHVLLTCDADDAEVAAPLLSGTLASG